MGYMCTGWGEKLETISYYYRHQFELMVYFVRQQLCSVNV